MKVKIKNNSKIYALIPSSGKYGAEKSLINFTANFESLYKNEIRLVPLTHSNINLENNSTFIFRSRRILSVTFVRDYFKFLCSVKKDDILILWTTLPAILFWPFSFIIGCQVIISERDSLVNPHNFLIRLIRNFVYRYFNNKIHFLFNSFENRAIFQARFQLSMTHVLHNEIKKFNKVNINFKKLQYPNTRVALIGRINEQKGTLFSLMILHSLFSKNDGVQIFIYGDFTEAKYEHQLMSFIGASDLEIHIIGFKDIEEILSENFEFVLSLSQHEGLPNLLLDCISLNQIIFYNDCPTGPREILGENSPFLIKYNDINDAIWKLYTFLNNKEYYRNEFELIRENIIIKYGQLNYITSLSSIFYYV